MWCESKTTLVIGSTPPPRAQRLGAGWAGRRSSSVRLHLRPTTRGGDGGGGGGGDGGGGDDDRGHGCHGCHGGHAGYGKNGRRGRWRQWRRRERHERNGRRGGRESRDGDGCRRSPVGEVRRRRRRDKDADEAEETARHSPRPAETSQGAVAAAVGDASTRGSMSVRTHSQRPLPHASGTDDDAGRRRRRARTIAIAKPVAVYPGGGGD